MWRRCKACIVLAPRSKYSYKTHRETQRAVPNREEHFLQASVWKSTCCVVERPSFLCWSQQLAMDGRQARYTYFAGTICRSGSMHMLRRGVKSHLDCVQFPLALGVLAVTRRVSCLTQGSSSMPTPACCTPLAWFVFTYYGCQTLCKSYGSSSRKIWRCTQERPHVLQKARKCAANLSQENLKELRKKCNKFGISWLILNNI